MSDWIECPADGIPLDELLSFALTYDGYRRLGQDPGHLRRVVQPVLTAIENGRPPPKWAGLDLLRGTLFFIQRMTHHWGDVPDASEAQMRTLVAAIREAAHGMP